MSSTNSDIDDIVNQFGNFPTERRFDIGNSSQTRMAQPSIRDYLDTIPPFNGDPILISNFILACENIIEILGRPNDNVFNSFLVAHIRSKLVGRAAQLIAVRNLKSWAELKQAILFTFGDQRDEDALMRDLITLKQENSESSLGFGEKCQDTLSLLLSKVNSTVVSENLREEKIRMYRDLAVKTFMKGVKEPYSLIVRCRNPQTLEEAINIISEENNLNYIRKMSQNSNHQFGINRNHQNNFQMPRQHPLPTYSIRPAFGTTATPRPTFINPSQQNNRPYQWPSKPNYWQSQALRPTTSLQPFRPQINNTFNNSMQRRQQNYPIPMDTSSGNTNIPRNHFQQSNVQKPRFKFEELHYTDLDNNGYQQEYPVDQYEPNIAHPQLYYEFCDQNQEHFEEYMEHGYVSEPPEQEPTVTEPENQDFTQDHPTKTPR